MGINFANLTKIPHKLNSMVNIKNRFKITVCKIQPVKPKEDDLLTYFNTSYTDACILAETWLIWTDSGKAWTACMALNTNNCRMITSNRKNRHGGGLALVHKMTLMVKTHCRSNKIIPVCKVVNQSSRLEHGYNSHIHSIVFNQVPSN